MTGSDELDAVLRTAEALAARASAPVKVSHLADALLRSAQGVASEPRPEPPPEWSPAATGAIERATQLAASEGGQMAERRHLAAALTEIIRTTDMLATAGRFADYPPTRTEEGGLTYSHTVAIKIGRAVAIPVEESDQDEPQDLPTAGVVRLPRRIERGTRD